MDDTLAIPARPKHIKGGDTGRHVSKDDFVREFKALGQRSAEIVFQRLDLNEASC